MTELAGTVSGNFTGAAFVGHHHEVVTRLRHLGQTLNLDWNRRSCGLDALAVLIQHGAHTSVGRASQHHVTRLERTRLHQDRGNRAASLVQLGFDHQTLGHRVHGCTQLKHFSLQQDLLQQGVNAFTGLRRDGDERRVATELFRHHFFDHQFILDPFRIGVWFVNLVDCHHDRHTGCPGVLDRFLGLWHHTIVSGHDQNHNIGRLGTTGTHGGKGLVTRRIKEGNDTARRFHVVSADVLCDAARFARSHFGASDVIEQ